MRIENLMTQNPRRARVHDHLDAIAREMWEGDCGAVPVIDDEGRLAGIITDRDVCMAAYTQGKPLRDIPVTVAMTRQVVSVSVQDTIEAAEHIMRRECVRRLPVIDRDGRPVGILSLSDLVREAVHDGHDGAPHAADVAQVLADICEPRFQVAPSAA